jgi:hypothetical protein
MLLRRWAVIVCPVGVVARLLRQAEVAVIFEVNIFPGLRNRVVIISIVAPLLQLQGGRL